MKLWVAVARHNFKWVNIWIITLAGKGLNLRSLYYCRSGNICEVLKFVNFAKSTNSRIQESRENYYYNSATEEK